MNEDDMLRAIGMTKEESLKIDHIMSLNNEKYERLELPDGFPLGYTIRHEADESGRFVKYIYTDPGKGIRLTVEVVDKEHGTLGHVHEGTVESMYVRLLMWEFLDRFVEELDVIRVKG